MFGFSLQKLIVLVVVVAAVWYGFKFITRLQDARRTDAELRDSAARRPTAAKGPAEAEDMVQCPVCQAYIQARGATDCGRADCPY
ncbi:MAG: hypothetical protein V3S40_13295 [Kiloniellales bacterium]